MLGCLLGLTIVCLIIAVASREANGDSTVFGMICGFVAFVGIISLFVITSHNDDVQLKAEHARIEKQVNVPELTKYYAYDTKIQDNGKTVIIETTEYSNATNIAKIKEDLSKSNKIKDVQFLANSDKHAKIILVVKLK